MAADLPPGPVPGAGGRSPEPGEPPRRWASVRPVADRVATRCPLRVVFDRFPPADAVRAPATAVDEVRRIDRAAFVAEVHAGLATLAGAVVVEPGDGAEAATLAALADGAPIVLGAVLPVDQAGRRRADPVVLARAERRPDGGWAYHPVLLERHGTTLPPGTRRPAAVIAPLERPWFAGAAVDPLLRARTGGRDGLRLAHHHRLLQACGHGAADAAGGVVGTEGVVVWQRLDRSNPGQPSTLDRHDAELAFRLDALEAAAAGVIRVPSVNIGECAGCPWFGHCGPVQRAADSASLLPGIGYAPWRALREAGLATRASVAGLDHRAALVRDEATRWGGLDRIVERASRLEGSLGVAAVVGAEGAAALDPLGVRTVDDVLGLDPRVIRLGSAPLSSLAEAVHRARLHQADGGPELRHGVPALVVPAADVEIDLDMENALDGTPYLWGAWSEGAYTGIASWEPTSPAVAADVFVRFWAWLSAQRDAAHAAGRTIACWCWYAQAESGALRAGARAAADRLDRPELVDEVEAFVAGPELVDLHRVFTTQLLTDGSAGLKAVATVAGFAWRDEEPSGEASMAWHDEAVGAPEPAARDAARRRLLAYNEDDVRATAAVRRWMREDLPARLASRSI